MPCCALFSVSVLLGHEQVYKKEGLVGEVLAQKHSYIYVGGSHWSFVCKRCKGLEAGSGRLLV